MVKQTDSSTDAAEGTAALAKGIALLRAIVAHGDRVGVGDLGEQLGLSRTTTHRLLAELQRQGLVMRTRRGRYGPGLGLVALTSGLSAHGQLAQAAREPLARLVAQCGLTAHLGILQNDMVTYLVKAPSRRAAELFTQEQGQLEAYCSGIGKVLLSHLPPLERSAYLANGPFVALTSRTLIEPSALADALEVVRIQDFAADEGEIADGLRCLAVPVRNTENRVVAAMSISITEGDVCPPDDEILTRLRAAATEVGLRLAPAST